MTHNKVAIAMKKAKSSLDKVLKMIGEGKYCIDVIQQNLAVIGLLRSANTALLEGHVNNCIKNAVNQKNNKRVDEMMTELLKVIKIAQTK
mgnify:CR=1 FL=1